MRAKTSSSRRSLARSTLRSSRSRGPREAEALEHGVGAFLGRDRVALLPPWEALPSEAISPSAEVVARRARAARAVRAADGPFVLVASAHAAVQPISPTLLEAEPVVLEEDGAGAGRARGAARRARVRATDIVEHRGEFALRGGIVDVFPGTARRPARAEYVGDQIESLREFVPATQRSTEVVRSVEALPVRELLATPELRKRAEREAPRHLDRFRDQLARFADGLVFEGMETLAPLLLEPSRLPVPAELLPPARGSC